MSHRNPYEIYDEVLEICKKNIEKPVEVMVKGRKRKMVPVEEVQKIKDKIFDNFYCLSIPF
jgi:hypothetical protein